MRGVFDEPLVDVVGRGEAQEFEAEGLAENRQVEHRVIDDVDHKREQQGHGQDLQDDRARILVAPKPEQKIGFVTDLFSACLIGVARHPCPRSLRPLLFNRLSGLGAGPDKMDFHIVYRETTTAPFAM